MSEWGAISWIDGVEGPKRFMTVNSVTILTKGLLFFMCYHLWLSNYFTSVRIVVTSSSLFLVVTLRTNWKMSTFLLLLQKIYTHEPFFIFQRGICCGCNIEVKGWPTKIWVRSDSPPFYCYLPYQPASVYRVLRSHCSTLYKLGPSPATQQLST